jgi:hypothetical protein
MNMSVMNPQAATSTKLEDRSGNGELEHGSVFGSGGFDLPGCLHPATLIHLRIALVLRCANRRWVTRTRTPTLGNNLLQLAFQMNPT